MSFCRMLGPQAEGSKEHWHPIQQPVDAKQYHYVRHGTHNPTARLPPGMTWNTIK